MSKKSKKLEKENDVLKKQKEALNTNILNLAEERTLWMKKSENASKQVQTLKEIIQAMQRQGRGAPSTSANWLERPPRDSRGGGEGDEESDYSIDGDEDDEEEAEEEEGEEEEVSDFDDDDTEEEVQPPERAAPVTYGPERPPQPQPAASVNGH